MHRRQIGLPALVILLGHQHQRLDDDLNVVRLQFNEEITIFFRFRDFSGRYPMHCHNTVHEDHAMMVRWEIDDVGDLNSQP